jgi:zinc transport system substrate-binding protein
MRYIISLLLTSAALPALAEVPRVVTDIPPVHALVAQVMGDLGQPVLLLDKGANGHSFQMRPSQAAALQEAALVVWIGPSMTPWLDRALAGTTGATQLQLLTTKGTLLQEFGAKAEHAHADDTHDEQQDTDDHAAHTGADPHAWLDPANASHWLGVIATELSNLDAENAATYAANAAAAKDQIAALDAELAGTLAPLKGKPFVVFHDAYGYFTSHFGLTVAASITMGDAAAPGARHIAEVHEILAKGPTCLHPEVNHDTKLAEQMIEAEGVKLGAALDPEGAAFDPGPTVYADIMRGLAKSLVDCAMN